jgi:hypothetical protein
VVFFFGGIVGLLSVLGYEFEETDELGLVIGIVRCRKFVEEEEGSWEYESEGKIGGRSQCEGGTGTTYVRLLD